MANPNLSEIMEAAQKMQKSMKQKQEKLSQLIVNGESGAGLVSVRVNGRRQVLNVKLDPTISNESLEVQQTLIASAFNDAMKKLEKKIEEEFMDFAKMFNPENEGSSSSSSSSNSDRETH